MLHRDIACFWHAKGEVPQLMVLFAKSGSQVHFFTQGESVRKECSKKYNQP